MLPPIFIMVRLSKRLAAVAAHIPDGAAVIDVGTDHGLIPVYLAQNGLSRRIIASDVNPGPLQSAQALVRETDTGGWIRLFVRDGLDGFARSDADCVVIAGMGGENMAAILAAAPWTKENVLLVLQPQSKQAELRSFLIRNGYRIESESLVADAGRVYPILTARGGKSDAYTDAELHMGKWEQIGQDPLLPRYLDSVLRRQEKAAEYDQAAAALCQSLRQWKERLRSC